MKGSYFVIFQILENRNWLEECKELLRIKFLDSSAAPLWRVRIINYTKDDVTSHVTSDDPASEGFDVTFLVELHHSFFDGTSGEMLDKVHGCG